MAYETSSAANIDDVLDALRIFASGEGWTIDTWESLPNGNWLAMHKGTCFTSLYTNSAATVAVGNLKLRGHTSYDGGLDYDKQPGMKGDPYWSDCNDVDGGPFVAHHFFAGDTFIHVVLEVQSGRFVHFGFGILEKYGSYLGGEYTYGAWWYLNHTSHSGTPVYGGHKTPFSNGSTGTFVRFEEHDCTLDSYKNWASLTGTPYSGTGSITGQSIDATTAVNPTIAGAYILQPNYFNGVNNLHPYNVLVGRTGNNTSMLGAPKEMRYISIKALTPGSELVLGSDTWMVFPTKQKGEQIVGNVTPFSLWYGIAYKKVV